ncbi:hypothetical protein BGZ96_004149 [Linnemannia gamsii]|uniref:Uncharacterized protein n=1 Tax=Linnemannia gamsii TaxID=64522 RepID=A0ABQ7K5Y4_9FUNG|nr:hypothetical protein BGZ96_004149 [Linnemannia gamsii]
MHWRVISHEFPTNRFAEASEQRSWSHLEDLSLGKLDERNGTLAGTLSHLPPMRRSRLQSSMFGPLKFDTFRKRLFNTIKDLDLTGAIDITSRMSLCVLEECIHLEEFKTMIINADDIDTVSSSRPPRVFRGLRRLELMFVFTSTASNDIAFEALSGLTNLEHLYVGHGKHSASELAVSYLQEHRV